VFPVGVHLFYEYVLCYFTYFIDPGVHLFQIKIHYSKVNRTTDVTMHRTRDCIVSAYIFIASK
jgi:hypothetical protein